MKKSALPKKLILSLASLAFTTVCLTSTTYAWFAQNSSAWTDDFNVNLKIEEGLQISVDGNRFYDSIDNNQVIRAIAAKRLNKKYEDVTDEEFKNTSINLAPVSTKDLVNFITITSESLVDQNEYYIPDTAKKEAYVEFDLYFKSVVPSSGAKDKYQLLFESKKDGLGPSRVTAESSTVKLSNELKVLESKDTRILTENQVKGTYKEGDSITLNPADAIRIGVIHHEDKKTVYELSEGYGSMALKNIPEELENKEIYEPQTNPMLTYFNNTHNIGHLDPIEYDPFYVNTEKNFENKISLGEFERTDASYNDIKITVLLWLEGYDADYLQGVDTKSVHFFLNFTKVEVQENEA